jgi:GNAT superfamily N-acetyltransferase
VVGWCHAAPRQSLPRLAEWAEDSTEFQPASPDPVGAIVCYVIAPGNRRQGVATALLREACEMLSDIGMEWAEAYPRHADAQAPASLPADAAAYHGSLSMYLAAGFEPLYRLGSMTVVRRPIAPGGGPHDRAPASS